jgi:hypothetical protein
MTDRINGLVVVLDRDYRDDDCEQIIEAIKMIRGVESVTKNVADLGSHIAKQQVRVELREKLIALYEDLSK